MSNFYTQVHCVVEPIRADQIVWLIARSNDLEWWQETYKEEKLDDEREIQVDVIPSSQGGAAYIGDDEYTNIDHMEHLLKEFQKKFPDYRHPIVATWSGYGAGDPDGGVIVVYQDGSVKWTSTWEWVSYLKLFDTAKDAPRIALSSVPPVMLSQALRAKRSTCWAECEAAGHDMKDFTFNPIDHSIQATCSKCGAIEIIKADAHVLSDSGESLALHPCKA